MPGSNSKENGKPPTVEELISGPFVQAGHVQVYGTQQDTSKGSGREGWLHCRAILHHLWKDLEVRGIPDDWKKANIMPIAKRAKREFWEATDQSASLQSLGKLWNRSSWKGLLFPGTWRTTTCLGKANKDLPTANCAWPAWLPSMTKLLPHWMSGELRMSSNLIVTKCLIWSPHNIFVDNLVKMD